MSDDLETTDSIEWGDLPPTKKERVKRMIPQLAARTPRWGRLPIDITKPVVLAAAAESEIPIDVATRKRDGVSRVWARIPLPDPTPTTAPAAAAPAEETAP